MSRTVGTRVADLGYPLESPGKLEGLLALRPYCSETPGLLVGVWLVVQTFFKGSR